MDQRRIELMKLAAKDPLLARCRDDALKAADAACKRPALKYQKTGPRLLSVSRECLKRTYALALAWRITGKQEYLDKARENLLAVCDFPDWNPSHFLDTAEMSHAVGIGYDWLFGSLDEQTLRKLRTSLVEKGLKPGLEVYTGKGWWSKSEFNWNQVCNGGLLIGALAIADGEKDLARRIVSAAVASLPKALATYEPDGAWPEGPGYWNYATSYTVYALAAMETALGRDFGLSDMAGLIQAGTFPLYATGPTGLYVNFADVGDNSRRGNIPCLLWLARRYGKPDLAAAELDMVRNRGADPLDFIWYCPQKGGKSAPLPLDKLFRGPMELAVFRSAWNDPDALFLSLKAGYNRVNHGHLDLGQFELDALGVRWARDLGSDDYNLPGYWDGDKQDGQRWTYYRLNSLSHNVPILSGRNQDVDAKAGFTSFKTSEDSGGAAVDLTSAYRGLAARVARGAAMVDGRRGALVQDELELTMPCEALWGMTTDAAVEIGADGSAVLKQDGKTLRATVLSPSGAKLAVESAERKPPQKTNAGVRRLVLRLPDARGAVRIAILLAPDWPDGKPVAAPEITPLAQW